MSMLVHFCSGILLRTLLPLRVTAVDRVKHMYGSVLAMATCLNGALIQVCINVSTIKYFVTNSYSHPMMYHNF